MKFEAFDFNELNRVFGLRQTDPGDSSNHDLRIFLESTLIRLYRRQRGASKTDRHVINVCRDYVDALIENDNGRFPIWEGLADIQDNKTFLETFILLLPVAWSS